MKKSQVLKVLKETVVQNNYLDRLDRSEKFQIFCNVCDNLLQAKTITEEQHRRWTNTF